MNRHTQHPNVVSNQIYSLFEMELQMNYTLSINSEEVRLTEMLLTRKIDENQGLIILTTLRIKPQAKDAIFIQNILIKGNSLGPKPMSLINFYLIIKNIPVALADDEEKENTTK